MNVDAKNVTLIPSQSSSPSPPTQSPRPSKSIPHVPTSSSGGNNPLPRPSPGVEASGGQSATDEQGKAQDQAAKVS